jgi:Ni/Co efflux regulator RcnB
LDNIMRVMTVAAAVLLMLAAPAALADKPGGKAHGQGKGASEERQGHGNAAGQGQAASVSFQFGDQDRSAIRDYYSAGKACPPGLAKKNNGCQPPGQAKKWSRGQVLPGDLVRYDVPRELLLRLTPPPSGHRYVRVAGDILLIAAGTSMVVDAIEDLGRL